MYITKQDIEKVLAIMEEFPDANSYKLEKTGKSGIGSILSLTMNMELKGHEATVTVEVSGVEDW